MKKVITKSVVFLIILLLLVLIWVHWQAFRDTGYSSSNVEKTFVIAEGDGSTEVGANLEKEKLIKNKYVFYYYVWLTKTSSKLQAGDYKLSPNMTLEEMVSKFTRGEIIPKVVKLTVPEGFTNKKIIELLREKKPEIADEFEKIVSCKCLNQADCSCDVFSEKYSFLQEIPAGIDLEGYLFPDTYFIDKEETGRTLASKFLNNFEKKIDDNTLTVISRQDKDLHEVLTLASIVEREVHTDPDRAIVAGIFWNRLKAGVALQSDATLAYILDTDKIKYYSQEMKTESPYNTYTNPGLPPGPIGNPGMAAIKAAVFFQDTDYFYFLSDPKTGENVFSKTNEEHAKNKAIHGL